MTVDELLETWSRQLPAAVTPSSALSKMVLEIARTLREAISSAVAQHGLTMAEYDLLAALRRAGAPFRRRPTDLTTELLLTSGGTTKALGSLESRGLVAREPDPVDRRIRWVCLTDHGVEVAEQALLASTSAQSRLFDGVPEIRLARATSTMRELSDDISSQGTETRNSS